jgi:hypothetical protein
MHIQIRDETLVQQIEQAAQQAQHTPEEIVLKAVRMYIQQLLGDEQDDASQTLLAWQSVYDGLSDDEVDEVELIALNRSQFMKQD